MCGKFFLSLIIKLCSSNIYNIDLGFSRSILRSVNSESLELRVAPLEHQNDTQVLQILLIYLDIKKFFVDVCFKGELVKKAISTVQNQVVTRSLPHQDVFMLSLPYCKGG